MSRVEGDGKVGSRLVLWTSAAILAVTAGVFACAEGAQNVAGVRADQTASKDGHKATKANPYAFVGEEHNREVDFVLRQFHKQYRKGMQKSEKCALLDRIIGDYIKSRKRADFDFRPASKGALCSAGNEFEGQSARGSLVRTASAYEDFSPAALELAYDVENIMLFSYSAADVAAALGPINIQAQNSLSGNDAALVLAASAVAQSSAYYWEANFDYWRETYTRDGTIMYPAARISSGRNDDGMTLTTHRASFAWAGVKAVGWADVGGGIAGGIRGAFGGPEGILFGAGSGAAYASIGAALGQIFAMM